MAAVSHQNCGDAAGFPQNCRTRSTNPFRDGGGGRGERARMGKRRKVAKKAKTSPAAAGTGGDRITALPLDLRALIASLLDFRQAVPLSALSRPWSHVHLHTPVVDICLFEFLRFPDPCFHPLRSVPGGPQRRPRRVPRGVDTLRLGYIAGDARMARHAARILALADAREIHVHSPYRGEPVREAWALELPPVTRDLSVRASDQLAPAVAGPGAAALRVLSLARAVVREWLPHLPSLRALSLVEVAAETPFAPAAWCPLLEKLRTYSCVFEHARVDIVLPRLRILELDELNLHPPPCSNSDGPPFAEIIIDAPELEMLDVYCTPWSTRDYRSFTLQAPRLRWLYWQNQFAERVRIDVGKPGSVEGGLIELVSIYTRELKFYQEQMMRMLRGLLPDVPPESIDDVTRAVQDAGKV
ncbi:hypothetical protein ACP4OV_007080 [Aristida adscensionis]